MKLKNTNP